MRLGRVKGNQSHGIPRARERVDRVEATSTSGQSGRWRGRSRDKQDGTGFASGGLLVALVGT
jgi:hypothetical protein